VNSPEDLFRLLQVVFGIGLVIFVHEAGHFLAARLCGVRVEVFSLGFGPRLFGWRRGATLYQVAAIPVGGYVRMAGEMGDGSGRPPRSDDLVSKSVGQRFFIYSGGVLMNVLFALVVFPLVLASGVPTTEPIVVPDKGSPAWQAGIEPGTRVLSVGGDEVYDFWHIPSEVALAGRGPIDFVVLPPGAGEPLTVPIEPVYSTDGGFRQVGVRQGFDPQLRLSVDEHGPAWEAGLRTDDRWLGVDGVPRGLPLVEQIARAFGDGEPRRVHVLRDGQELAFDVTPTPEPSEPSDRLFGITPLQNRVGAWRAGDPHLSRLGLVRGERLIAIDDHPIEQPDDVLDALLAPAADPAAPTVFRFRDEAGVEREARLAGRLDEEEAVRLDGNLFLDHDPESSLVYVAPDRPAARGGLRTGDRLRAIGTSAVSTWKTVYDQTRKAAKRSAVVVVAYERRAPDGSWARGEALVEPEPMTQYDYGFGPRAAQGIYRTDSLGASISAGFDASWRFLTDAWLTLKKMLTQEVSTENMGGIITIGTVSYSFAAEGWAKLFFFLCMLSINLAFLNVLPIPVLDGGHLFFCVVEAIKGSPVSERTLGYSQVVGLVLILTLMVYVTYQDVLKILPP